MDKILTFIVNEYNEILLLKGNFDDPQFHESFWYTVTGGCEKYDSCREDTVKREIFEETGLNKINDILYLNWIFKYNSLGIDCTEYAYVTFVEKENVVLNEENIEYKWCNFDECVEKMKWYGDKKILRNVLDFALNKKVFLKSEKIENVLFKNLD